MWGHLGRVAVSPDDVLKEPETGRYYVAKDNPDITTPKLPSNPNIGYSLLASLLGVISLTLYRTINPPAVEENIVC